MKYNYKKPETRIVKISSTGIIATSVILSKTEATTDEGVYTNALVKEDLGWDIWGSNDDFEE